LALTYTPEWQPIKEALERIVASGLPRAQAKRDLCRAIADGAIAVRQTLAANASLGQHNSLGQHKYHLVAPELSIPVDLSPSDIDWRHSRPIDTLNVWADFSQRPGEWAMLRIDRRRHLLERTVALIEVRTADVSRIFCAPAGRTDTKPPVSPPKQKPTKRDAVKQVISELWPDRTPTGLTANDLKRQINDRLKANRLSNVSDRTIQRALKELGRRSPELKPDNWRQVATRHDKAPVVAMVPYRKR
jgi:hypothetical protein